MAEAMLASEGMGLAFLNFGLTAKYRLLGTGHDSPKSLHLMPNLETRDIYPLKSLLLLELGLGTQILSDAGKTLASLRRGSRILECGFSLSCVSSKKTLLEWFLPRSQDYLLGAPKQLCNSSSGNLRRT